LNFSKRRHPSKPTGPPPTIATFEVSIYFNFGLYSDLNYSPIESKLELPQIHIKISIRIFKESPIQMGNICIDDDGTREE
jgi:hypothetical protein